MPAITFNPGITWDNLPTAATRMVVDQEEIIRKIGLLRSDWKEATGGDLSNVRVNLDLLFNDIENMVTGG